MSQKNPEVLETIQDYLGCGSIHQHRRTAVHSLYICGRENVREFIERVYPHSVVKKRQLKLAYELVRSNRPPKAERLEIKVKLQALNRKLKEAT